MGWITVHAYAPVRVKCCEKVKIALKGKILFVYFALCDIYYYLKTRILRLTRLNTKKINQPSALLGLIAVGAYIVYLYVVCGIFCNILLHYILLRMLYSW